MGLLAACEDDAHTAQPASEAAEPTPHDDIAAGSAGDKAAPPAPREPLEQGPPPPELGCRVTSAATLGNNLGAASLAVRDDGVWVASYARHQGKRSLARFHVGADGKPRALPPIALGEAGPSPARVPPAIHAGGSLWIAAVDARGDLKVWPRADAETPGTLSIAPRVDRRFAPALRELDEGRALVAYTEGDATGMRVQAVVVQGDSLTRHAVTPLGHGASAPHFLEGSADAQLLVIDARSGMSPLLRIPFDGQGSPGEAQVERPVNLPYSPPDLVAVALPDGAPHVAYTAIGNGATAAVGLVPLGSTDPPVAVLRGSGYALLSVDVAVGPARAVFAVDAPVHSKPDPPLEVQLRVWDGERLGEALRLEGGGEGRSRPAVAYDPHRKRVMLVSVRGTTLELHALRCDV